jgi:Zn-dependent protease with chaperone function
MRRHTILRRAGALGAGLALVALTAGCSVTTSPRSTSTGSASPSSTSTPPRTSAPSEKTVPIDSAQAQRLQRVMVPLLRVMDHPRQPSQVKIGLLDDSHINAASAGGGEFYVTRGLLEKANDAELSGVIAHELAHDDLGHVAKAQRLGAGLSVGMVILDQILPGAGALAPIAGQIIINRYTQREEYQADAHGAELLQRAGSSKQVMIDTLNWLQKTEGASGGGFFATHPTTGDRIQALRNTATK